MRYIYSYELPVPVPQIVKVEMVYDSREEAEKERADHASFGVKTFPVVPVPDDYKPVKGD